MTAFLQSPIRMAKLLASVNVPGSDRPLTPIEVSKEIRCLLDELGGDKTELLNRLPLAADMINGFLSILGLPQQIHDVIGWGPSDPITGRISFSVARQLCRLDGPDILRLVGVFNAASKPITRDEVMAAVSFKRANPEKPIEECMKEITRITRPRIIHHYLFISGIDPESVRRLKSSAIGRKLGLNEHTLAVISDKMPSGSVLGAKIGKDYVRLTLSKDGSEFIQTYADRNGLTKREVIDHMVKSE